ncbi:uncharacterized protein C8A04DRAFT_11026 [Dichotomopilus funicola]|uniref:DUF6594 domain-containing protein n=1 Tax=Dichotomopilus funicola TaxID=1934379 RepID=A0AAN6V5W7_9PEZI|nr:hypothetical protein C8A04DRAFT_11026 [Dichotomopilus funicola]
MANPIPLKSQANYHRLSSLMRNGPDLAIFRRFGELNLMSLLSLQAEILQLESDYLSQLSRIGSPEKQGLRLLQAWLRDSKGGKNFLDGVEAETWTDPEESNYISLGPPPPEKDIFSSFLRDVLLRIFHVFCGERFKMGRVVDEESGIRSYDDSRIDKASSLITVILASVLPVLAIFVLNSLSTTNARIGTIVGFTAAFATILAIFSSAKRAEIFAATAT